MALTTEQIKAIKNSPKFIELTEKRGKFAWQLSIVMLVIYYAFILVIAFDPSFFSSKIGDGVTTLGIPIGIGVIISCFVLTGIYVNRANSEFDELTAQIKKDAKVE